ncbi:hypothetical protein [uncultured Methanobrevibacter sp.]|uniref:hypothetical protein n=1 Tax=uncultured Methanobrevibacter sp. TaxID=253161 RepID=UPI0025DFBFE1|nr:hypothetical protein [uncultured Methanobrevibacter sp.]
MFMQKTFVSFMFSSVVLPSNMRAAISSSPMHLTPIGRLTHIFHLLSFLCFQG